MTIQSPGRSLTLPPGFALSSFAQSPPRRPRPIRWSGTSGVPPMRSRMVPRTRSRTRSAVRATPLNLGADGLQRAAGETKRLVAVARGFGGVRPTIEDHPQQVRRALLSELPRLLERATGSGAAGLHADLADEHEHAHLRVDLIDLARELERVLRLLHRGVGIILGEHFCLRRLDRRECPVALGFLGKARGARQRFTRSGDVPVLDVQPGRAVEGARDLIQQTELLEELQALLVVVDRGLDVARVVIGLR